MRKEAERRRVDDADLFELETLQNPPLGLVAPMLALALDIGMGEAEGLRDDRRVLGDVGAPQAEPPEGERE